ncbi:uncharacterized protein LOC122322711 [Drosophila grimshawi]|uniref:uncharacterized protein LOC122322711 n=1 Tax=Drosophila grimshawi TaxID=7222 RepID=UPI001C9354FD|nr:uncharacterized protein LOC122322711 [Drosophila grimshawi]
MNCIHSLVPGKGPSHGSRDAGWYQGNTKVIACQDARSVELYKAAVAELGEVYPGAKLVAVDWSEVPSRPRSRIWISASLKVPDQVLNLLQLCNPSLPTHDWRVVKIEATNGPTNQAVPILNKESLAPIEAAKGELNFGFGSITVKIYKSDAPVGGDPVICNKTAEQGRPAEIGATHEELEPGYT